MPGWLVVVINLVSGRTAYRHCPARLCGLNLPTELISSRGSNPADGYCPEIGECCCVGGHPGAKGNAAGIVCVPMGNASDGGESVGKEGRGLMVVGHGHGGGVATAASISHSSASTGVSPSSLKKN